MYCMERATNGSAAYDLYVPNDVVVKKGRQVIPLGFCMELDQHLAAEIHPRSGYASKGMEGYEIIAKETHVFNPINGVCSEIQKTGQYASLEKSRFDADVIYGLVDEDYRGEIGVIVNNHGGEFLIKKGTRIAQMLLTPVVNVDIEEVLELSATERGEGGFGSTNK